MTDFLTAWTGRAVRTEVLYAANATLADTNDATVLDVLPGVHIQRRHVLLRAGETVVAEAESSVLISSPALEPDVRDQLWNGASLGDALRTLHRRRVCVGIADALGRAPSLAPDGNTAGAPDIARLASGPTGDGDRRILSVHSRLDVGGIPVASVREYILEAVLQNHVVHIPEPKRVAAPGSVG
ncbi:chorismate-pyruvate lyase [Pseudonocardia eucalypti]|nr:chorismate-pyruvate lyase [Pseudonocardia eucalypti]